MMNNRMKVCFTDWRWIKQSSSFDSKTLMILSKRMDKQIQ